MTMIDPPRQGFFGRIVALCGAALKHCAKKLAPHFAKKSRGHKNLNCLDVSTKRHHGSGRPARHLLADSRGNVLVITAAALVPMIFAIGFGIDYGHAQYLQNVLNNAADAAALAAVDPGMISQSDAVASTAASNMFNTQTSGYWGLNNVVVTPTITDSFSGSLGVLRTVTVSYTAQSTNFFGAILNLTTLAISGTGTASSSQAASINFYVVLDTSPSMLLPTTSTGISQMLAGTARTNTPQIGAGCAFGCHTANPQSFTYANDTNGYTLYTNTSASASTTPFFRVNSPTNTILQDNNGVQLNKTGTSVTFTGTGTKGSFNSTYANYSMKYTNTANTSVTVTVAYADTWWFARNYALVAPGQSNIELRIDAETKAAQGLLQYAANVEAEYSTLLVPPKYQMQFYTFNYASPAALKTSGSSPSTTPYGVMTDVATTAPLASSTFPDLGLQAPLLWDVGYWTTSSVSNADEDTDIPTMLTTMSSTILPKSAGAGTVASPQSVMILVTDGMMDISRSGTSCLQSGRVCSQLTATELAQCAAIKNAGTRIAILYTVYDPATLANSGSIFSSSQAQMTTTISQIQAALQSCASQNPDGSYLMQTVTSGGSISAALTQLFAMAVRNARLVK